MRLRGGCCAIHDNFCRLTCTGDVFGMARSEGPSFFPSTIKSRELTAPPGVDSSYKPQTSIFLCFIFGQYVPGFKQIRGKGKQTHVSVQMEKSRHCRAGTNGLFNLDSNVCFTKSNLAKIPSNPKSPISHL